MRAKLPIDAPGRSLYRHCLSAIAIMAVLSGCRGMRPADSVLSGPEAYSANSAAIAATQQQAYRLGRFDRINVTVFREDQLSVRDGEIDPQGSIGLPLLGPVPAAGRTTDELAADIAGRLSPTYLKNPQVTVTLSNSVTQRVTVTGDVVSPGVYPYKGDLTLMQALALAQDTERTVRLDEMIVFRNINGERMAAKFNLKRIRAGYDPDPQILPDDVIVAGFSNLRGLWVDFLQAAPFWGWISIVDNNN